MKQFINNIFGNNILSGTAIVTLGVLISSVFSYLLQLALARPILYLHAPLLTVSDYGTFNTLLSYYSIFAIPITVFSLSLVKISSELKVEERFDKLTHLFWSLTFTSLAIGSTIFLFLLIFRNYISAYSNINNPELFLVLGIFICVSFLLIAPGAYLQGLLRFKGFATFAVLGSFLRFIVPVAFVYFGLGVSGVYIGMSIAVIITFLFSILILKKNFTPYKPLNVKPEFKRLLNLSGSVFFINLGLLTLNNVDIILVKKYFEGDVAGYYSSLVTVGKILLFGAGAVAIVMFPQITQLYNSGKHVLSTFRKFFLIQLIVIFIGIAVFSFFSEFIVNLFFGSSFLPAVAYLPKFSLFVGLYVIINFMVLFLLSVNKHRVFFLQIPVSILQFLLLSAFHDSISTVIDVNIIVSILLLLAIGVYFYVYRNTIDAKV